MSSRASPRPATARRPDAGFTLLETVLAFAIIAMVVVAGLVAVSQSLARQARIARTYVLSEVARSVLTEYLVTYPDLPAGGNYGERWGFRIEEAPVVVADLAELGLEMHYRSVRATVWALSAPREIFGLETVTARRGTAR